MTLFPESPPELAKVFLGCRAPPSPARYSAKACSGLCMLRIAVVCGGASSSSTGGQSTSGVPDDVVNKLAWEGPARAT